MGIRTLGIVVVIRLQAHWKKLSQYTLLLGFVGFIKTISCIVAGVCLLHQAEGCVASLFFIKVRIRYPQCLRRGRDLNS